MPRIFLPPLCPCPKNHKTTRLFLVSLVYQWRCKVKLGFLKQFASSCSLKQNLGGRVTEKCWFGKQGVVLVELLVLSFASLLPLFHPILLFFLPLPSLPSAPPFPCPHCFFFSLIITLPSLFLSSLLSFHTLFSPQDNCFGSCEEGGTWGDFMGSLVRQIEEKRS